MVVGTERRARGGDRGRLAHGKGPVQLARLVVPAGLRACDDTSRAQGGGGFDVSLPEVCRPSSDDTRGWTQSFAIQKSFAHSMGRALASSQ